MKKRKSPRRARPASRSRSGRSWWPWLGAGALGLAAFTLLRSPAGPRRRPDRAGAADADLSGGLLPSSPEAPRSLPEAAERSWVSGPGGSLHFCELHPEGETTVVFVHEVGGRLEHWAGVLAAAGPSLRAVALDLPGHGHSDTPVATANLNHLAAAVGAVYDNLGLRRAVLVGHGLGASAALAYASCHRERVAGLLLVDAGADLGHLDPVDRRQLVDQLRAEPHQEMAWQFRQMMGDAPEWVAEQVAADLESVPAEVLADAVESALEFRPGPAVEAYGGEVRCVVGGFGDLPGTLHRTHPEIPVAYVTRGSHWLPLDSPDSVWEALVELLASLHEAEAL